MRDPCGEEASFQVGRASPRWAEDTIVHGHNRCTRADIEKAMIDLPTVNPITGLPEMKTSKHGAAHPNLCVKLHDEDMPARISCAIKLCRRYSELRRCDKK